MQWWYYSGQVTTTVLGVEAVLDPARGLIMLNDAADNARVIKPRTRFAANMGAVQHLARIKKVKSIPIPREARMAMAAAQEPTAPVPKEAPVAEAAPVVTKSAPEPEPVASSRDASGSEPVVVSPATDTGLDLFSEEGEDLDLDLDPGEAEEGEPHSSSELSGEKQKPRRKKRRGV